MSIYLKKLGIFQKTDPIISNVLSGLTSIVGHSHLGFLPAEGDVGSTPISQEFAHTPP